MHRVTLRDYLSRIDRLINENRLPEAAAHCHFILQQYPRYVDTYRLFGRVLLEQQKYSEAIDVFLRVSSAVPEDLIAHAGLALAYKEKLDLPRAAWHMERAFEIDPYNRAIRDELTELRAARDGYSSERIELTRAALARLYFRGALYGQAATELTGLLRDHPKRYDLSVLLADALFWDGRRSDLVDVCLGIVEDLPYCIKANAILAAVWMRSGRPTEANEHWRRVQALTLMTADGVDPDSTLGRVMREGEGLSFPGEVVVDELDDITAATVRGDQGVGWSPELAAETDGDEQVPGWLQEIGFNAMDDHEQPVSGTVDQGADKLPADDDWLEDVTAPADVQMVADVDPVGEGLDDFLAAELLAMVDSDDVPDMSGVEATSSGEFGDAVPAVADEVEADLEADIGAPVPADTNLDDIIDEAFGPDFMAAPAIAAEVGQDSEDWTEAVDELSSLVDELQAYKTGTTLPLAKPETAQRDPDWLDDLADSSDVTQDLPDWLYESVGFTDELVEPPNLEAEELSGQVEKDEMPAVAQEPDVFPEIIDSEGMDFVEGQNNLEQQKAGVSDSDLPDWLINADDVLEELPEELLETSDDSWLEGMIDKDEDVSWLDELVNGPDALEADSAQKQPGASPEETIVSGAESDLEIVDPGSHDEAGGSKQRSDQDSGSELRTDADDPNDGG